MAEARSHFAHVRKKRAERPRRSCGAAGGGGFCTGCAAPCAAPAPWAVMPLKHACMNGIMLTVFRIMTHNFLCERQSFRELDA